MDEAVNRAGRGTGDGWSNAASTLRARASASPTGASQGSGTISGRPPARVATPSAPGRGRGGSGRGEGGGAGVAAVRGGRGRAAAPGGEGPGAPGPPPRPDRRRIQYASCSA